MKLSEAIAALERGEEVEWRCKRTGDDWSDLSSDTDMPTLLPKDFEFRLKPKPVEPVTLWVNFYSDPERTFVHTSKKTAKRESDPGASRIAVPFREVVPLTEEEKSELECIKNYFIKSTSPSAVTFLLDLLKKQGVE